MSQQKKTLRAQYGWGILLSLLVFLLLAACLPLRVAPFPAPHQSPRSDELLYFRTENSPPPCTEEQVQEFWATAADTPSPAGRHAHTGPVLCTLPVVQGHGLPSRMRIPPLSPNETAALSAAVAPTFEIEFTAPAITLEPTPTSEHQEQLGIGVFKSSASSQPTPLPTCSPAQLQPATPSAAMDRRFINGVHPDSQEAICRWPPLTPPAHDGLPAIPSGIFILTETPTAEPTMTPISSSPLEPKRG